MQMCKRSMRQYSSFEMLRTVSDGIVLGADRTHRSSMTTGYLTTAAANVSAKVSSSIVVVNNEKAQVDAV